MMQSSFPGMLGGIEAAGCGMQAREPCFDAAAGQSRQLAPLLRSDGAEGDQRRSEDDGAERDARQGDEERRCARGQGGG